MIDLSRESPLPLAAACRIIPAARGGKRTHISTLLRWILQGAKSPSGNLVRLDGIRIGNRWHTSREAIQRFAEALTPRTVVSDLPVPRTAAERQRTVDRADRILDREGL
jgi:Protein of unknown function (DUF1580)